MAGPEELLPETEALLAFAEQCTSVEEIHELSDEVLHELFEEKEVGKAELFAVQSTQVVYGALHLLSQARHDQRIAA